MYDLNQFSEEAVSFDVEHQGQSLTFYVKPTSLHEVLARGKTLGNDAEANMRKMFREVLLDDEHNALSKDWIDQLFGKPNLIPLGFKINAAMNNALGLSDIIAKKG